MDNKIRLPILSTKEVTSQAVNIINEEKSGKQLGLYCRYERLNIAMGKYFRFGTINLWAGLSGSGKSYLINILNNDFLDKELNKDIDFVPIIIHFGFEMSAYVEILRSCATELNISYNKLLNSEYNAETNSYEGLDKEEYDKVLAYIDTYNTKSIMFVESSGNTSIIYNTALYIVESYNKRSEVNKINYRFIFNFDHTLLFERLGEKDTLELMSNIGKLAIKLKKEFGAMVNLLGQMNNNLEDTKRITNPALHYPQKSDIYAQSEVYNACDNVFVMHQPSLLKILYYGIKKYPTKDLIHILKLKSRHGYIGSLWFVNKFDKGRMVELKNPEEKPDKNIEDDTILKFLKNK